VESVTISLDNLFRRTSHIGSSSSASVGGIVIPDQENTHQLRDAEQGSAELTKRPSLSAQADDFHAYRCRQHRVGCVPAKLAQLMLQVLLGLRRDIPASPLPLKFGDKLSGCAHLMTVEGNRPPSMIEMDKPPLHDHREFLGLGDRYTHVGHNASALIRRWALPISWP
jgi:hypothetical protein